MASTSKGNVYISIPQTEGNEIENQNFVSFPQNEDAERIENETPNLNRNFDGYGWDDIHKAAFLADSRKLLETCRTLTKNQINSLTVLSENALHILLENCTKGNNHKICCQNGAKMTMCAIVNQETAVANKCKKDDQKTDDQNQENRDPTTSKRSSEKSAPERLGSKQGKVDDKIDQNILSENQENNGDHKMIEERDDSDRVNISHKKVTYQKSRDQNQENQDPTTSKRSIKNSSPESLGSKQGKVDHKIDQNIVSEDQENNSDHRMNTEERDDSDRVNVSHKKVTYQKNGNENQENEDPSIANKDQEIEETDQENKDPTTSKKSIKKSTPERLGSKQEKVDHKIDLNIVSKDQENNNNQKMNIEERDDSDRVNVFHKKVTYQKSSDQNQENEDPSIANKHQEFEETDQENKDPKTGKKSIQKRILKRLRLNQERDHKIDHKTANDDQKSGDQNQENEDASTANKDQEAINDQEIEADQESKDPKTGKKSIKKTILKRLRMNRGEGDHKIDHNTPNDDQENSDQINFSGQKVRYRKSGPNHENGEKSIKNDKIGNDQKSDQNANQKTYRISETEDDVYRCAEILVQSEINVNHPNFWNETPIILAIRYRRWKIVNLLLDVKNIDLDTCKDPISGKTPREILMAKNTKLCLVLPPQQPKPLNPLFGYLKSGNEEMFLKHNNGKISYLVNCLDGENEESSSCDLLQFCFRKSLILWHQEKNDNDLQFLHQDMTANRMVQVFCKTGMAKCVQHLLDNNVNIDRRLKRFQNRKTVLETAISKGFYPIVALILSHKNCNLQIDKICDSLNDLITSKINNIYLNNTVSIVLNKLLETPKDPNLHLDQVLENGHNILSKDNILLLLKFPESLSNASIDKIKPEILEEHLNDCIFRENGKILIDCQSFVQNNTMETIFGKLLKSEKAVIHPVFKIFIMRHWKHLHYPTCLHKIKYFYVVFTFFLIFYAFINVYIICDFNEYEYTHIVSYFLRFFLIIFTVKEIFQMYQAENLKKYFIDDYTNIIEIALIVCVVLILVIHENWIDTVKVLTILLSNFLFLLLALGVPKYARYIIIWKAIIYYMHYIKFYIVQFVAFAICFHILFFKDGENPLLDLPDRLFNTFILFTGNLDYMKTPWTEDSKNTTLHHDFQFKEVFSKSIFTIFVIFIAVILHTLLLGLVVVDIGKINEQATIYEQVNRVSFVLKAESFFNEYGCVRKFFKYKKIQFGDSIEVNDEDKKVFRGSEENVLESILTKKSKKTNVLKKLKNYIETKLNEKRCEKEKSKKEISERLEFIEEIVKNLHDLNSVKNK